MSYLEGKRIKLTWANNEAISGLVIAETFDQGSEERNESFDVLLRKDDGSLAHRALVVGTKLEILDDDPTTPAQTYPWTDDPPTAARGAYIRIAVWYDKGRRRRFVDSISVFDPSADSSSKLKDNLPEAAAAVVGALRGPDPVDPNTEDSELVDAYNVLQKLLEGQTLDPLVPVALSRLFEAIQVVRPGKANPPGKKKVGKKKASRTARD